MGQSRTENILENILGASNPLGEPQSREEALLMQLLEKLDVTVVKWAGITTTALTDGASTNPITVDGKSYTAVAGDMVSYESKEFVFSGTIWQEFGDLSGILRIIGNTYDSTATYEIGDYTIYENKLYICTTAITTPETWNGLHWQQTTIIAALKALQTSIGNKMNKTNPTGTGALSLNRKANTTIGANSVAVGINNTASGENSFAEGGYGIASGPYSHCEGNSNTASGHYSHVEGSMNTASNYDAHAEGNNSIASGYISHVEGEHGIANHKSQHVFGEYNIADDSENTNNQRGNYVEIVGNGVNNSRRSNARTLDWEGNETIAGDLVFNGDTSLTEALAGKASAVNYSTSEVKTGQKWIDGKDIYMVTVGLSAYDAGLLTLPLTYSEVDKIIKLEGYARGMYFFNFLPHLSWNLYANGDPSDPIIIEIDGGPEYTDLAATVYYTKPTSAI